MKIAIMGAGALGGYFGGRLAEAGADVGFIARGEHLAALKRDGLRIESPLGDAHLTAIRATDDPAEIGPVDLVFFLVKLYDTETAAQALAPLLGRETAVFTFQNGIDGAARIGAIVGEERVVDGIAYIPADIRAPGVVRHRGDFARLLFGETDGRESARCRALKAALDGAGIDGELVSDIRVRKWQKFVMLSGLSAITTLTRLPIGAILADEACAQLFRDALAETAAVGRAACPDLPADAADSALAVAHSFPYEVHASMFDDLQRGKRLELMDLSGAVVREGAAHGIETPVHRIAMQALHPYLNGPPEPPRN